MATEKKFLAKSMKDYLIKLYLGKELKNAGVSSIAIQKTPLATRIAIKVKRPSMVIGKKGATVKSITEKLEQEFAVDNPQLDIIEVENAALDAKLVAERIARQIEIEGNVKQIMRINLRDVKEAGALGVEFVVAGKVIGKGAKAKSLRMRAGFLKKSGELKKLVDLGRATAYLKAGAIGVTVRIVRPGTVFPDAVRIDYEKIALLPESGEAPSAEKPTAPEDIEAERLAAERVAKAKEEFRRKKAEKKRRRRHQRPVKKKAVYEAENLIKSAETTPTVQAAQKKPEEKKAEEKKEEQKTEVKTN